MTVKIFRYSILVGILTLALCSILFFGLEYYRITVETLSVLQEQTNYVVRGVELEGKAYLEKLNTGRRITWIDPDGYVLFDSDGKFHSNQLNRIEVISAAQQGYGEASRKSESEGVDCQYYARRLPDKSIIRLSTPIIARKKAFETVFPVAWVFLLVFTVSAWLSLKAARRILRPVNQIDLDHPERAEVYPELSPLVSRLQEQRQTIQEQIEELHTRQRELTALTDNMTEGFLLLDKLGNVLSANASARLLIPDIALVDTFAEHADPVTVNVAQMALNGERGEALFVQNHRTWQLVGSPVRGRSKIAGAVLIWMDVTEREQRERLRQEFSANVSHELKTPLTSISGFAELMATGSVPSEKVVEFSTDILRETRRLIELVQNIIKLSKLDENSDMFEWESLNLQELAEEVLDSLRNTAEKAGVAMNLEGEDVTIRGVWALLNEMLYNLCDNAIKYNHAGGSVNVRTGMTDGAPFLQVSDTGIGIPEEEQDRVFERFYRVDKSHSKKIGGTGLGLSIVKHGAQFHNAKLILESWQGVGTTVRLVFQKET